MGNPQLWMVYKGKSHLEMDDDWGYPYFRKPLDVDPTKMIVLVLIHAHCASIWV